LKFTHNPRKLIELSKGIAVVKAKEGFHTHALKDLEGLLPILKLAEPHMYFDTLNSLAVELLEAGRIREASSISRIVLASPYAFAYPEWRETAQEIAERGYRSRAQVSVKLQPTPSNVSHIPQRDASSAHAAYWTDILSFQKWKQKMVKEPNGDQTVDITTQELDRMSEQDMIVKIFRLSSQEGLTREQLREILEHVLKVTKGEV
jgi:hypothetical protein